MPVISDHEVEARGSQVQTQLGLYSMTLKKKKSKNQARHGGTYL